MPPRKAPRVRVSFDAAPTSTPAPLSPAREAYNIVEIRQRVWRFLDKRSLARCMRVEKKGIYEVARELFREIRYDQAMSMKRTTARQRIYSDAVLEIDAREIDSSKLSATLRRELLSLARLDYGMTERARFPASALDGFCNNYHAGAFNLLLPILQKGCPNLRKVTFGDLRKPTTCIVRFAEIPPSSSSQSSESSAIIGHIDVFHDKDLYYPESLLQPHTSENPPSPQYTLSERFDVSIDPTLGASREETLRLIRDNRILDDLYKYASLGSLPVSLDDVTGLYDRQIVRGHTELLAAVRSENILPWDILDFQRLARVALTSLTILQLSNDLEFGALESSSRVTFADFPTLITTIREHLPNLAVLGIAMGGMDKAESACQDLVNSSCLDGGGALRSLTIRTPTLIRPLFNLLRAVSTICTSWARIDISPEEGTQEMVQTEFLQYLRTQPANRRAHLSTIDFATLDVASYQDVQNLRYHDDGRPRRLAGVNALRWCDNAQFSRETIKFTTAKLPSLTSQLDDFTDVIEHLKSMSGSATTAQVLEEASRAQLAAHAVAWASAKAAEKMQGVAERSRKTVLELDRYVQSLTKIAKDESVEAAGIE